MVIYRTILRDLKKNLARWSALFLLITFGVYFVVSILAATETTIKNISDYGRENKVEDGEFETLMPLNENAFSEVENLCTDVEKNFFLDYSIDEKRTLRVFKNRTKINIQKVDKGKNADEPNEVMIEKNYAKKNNIDPGDIIKIAEKDLIVSGTGTSPDYDSVLNEFTSLYTDAETFGTAFVNEETYEMLKRTGYSHNSEKYVYAFRGNNKDELKTYLDQLKTDDLEMSDLILKDQSGIELVSNYICKEDNPRIEASSEHVKMNKFIGIFGGIIVLVLFTYVISVFVINNIEKESVVIGALYSLGVHKKKILINYILLPLIVTLIASIFGTFLGYSKIGIKYQLDSSIAMYSVPEMKIAYTPYIMIYGLIMPVMICFIVNYRTIKKRIAKTPLSLLRNEKKESRSSNINIKSSNFIRDFQIKQFIRESRSGAMIFFGIIISLMLVILAVQCCCALFTFSDQSDKDIKYSNTYTLKYPLDEIPGEHERCIVMPLKKDFQEYTFNVTLIGVPKDSKYFDIDLPEDENSIVAGSGAVNKYGLKSNETFDAYDDKGKEYSFKITDTYQYAPGLTLFMDIDALRSRCDLPADYYNTVYSDSELNIPSEAIAVQSKKDDMIKYADVIMDSMTGMVYISLIASAAIFAVVIYLMTKISIERSSTNISLVRIFGFNKKEIRKMYLNGNSMIVILSLLISLPIDKKIMDLMWPTAVANIPCGFDTNIDWYYYLLIILGAMICYYLVYHFISIKLNRILPAEVLKNRE